MTMQPDHGAVGDLQKMVAQRFPDCPIAVLGDLMVDEYVVGRVERLSPEAPIPVMTDSVRSRAPGGAANVALNLRRLGADVRLGGVVGSDDAGQWLQDCLHRTGIDVAGVVPDGARPTTRKVRYRTERQQILRVDTEVTRGVEAPLEAKLLHWIKVQGGACQALVISDYCKGVFLSDETVRRVVAAARASGLTVGVDTKSRRPERFGQVTFFKPNQREMREASRTESDDVEACALGYLARTEAEAVVATLGERGILLAQRGKPCIHVPTVGTEVYDVTGAGDSVMAALVLGLASGSSFADAACLGNAAARVVIRKMGTATVTATELLDELARR